jgi:OPT oligopeptide transporter protein
VPVPFWIMYKLWPKLRTDCLYTPMIWYVDYVLSWLIAILIISIYICSYCIGLLSVGINSSVMALFVVGFASQWWLRTRYPCWFAKYNYILAAGLDGGTQVRSRYIHFILISFTKPC